MTEPRMSRRKFWVIVLVSVAISHAAIATETDPWERFVGGLVLANLVGVGLTFVAYWAET